jgi:hypothetical protein
VTLKRAVVRKTRIRLSYHDRHRARFWMHWR